MAAKLKAAEEASKSAADALKAELSRCKEEAALLHQDLAQAQITIEELRDVSKGLRGQLSAEVTAHNRTQEEKDVIQRSVDGIKLELKQCGITIEDLRQQIRKLEEEKLQLEADLRLSNLNKQQLEEELNRSLSEERRLGGALAEEKEHCATIEQRKELVDKKLGQTEAMVDTLRNELDMLHMTNDELAQESRRSILGLKDEMAKMKKDYDAEIQRLKEMLDQLEADRKQMESAYQFAKDELAVIRATLAEMEESSQRTQYIVEDFGNPTLVNRMNSEWSRVDGVGGSPQEGDSLSPKRTAFARDFRRAHSGPIPQHSMDPGPKQGALGHTPWRL